MVQLSIVKTYDVFCDGDSADCLTWTHGNTVSPTSARKEAAREGWKRVRGKDLCPNCVEKSPKEN